MKQVFIKFYQPDGTFKGFTPNFTFSAFTKNINSGVGELQVTIPEKFDFIDTTKYALNNKIKLVVADNDTPSGQTLYSGYIGKINANITDKESVRFTAYGNYTKLNYITYRSSATNVYVNTGSTRLDNTMKNIINTGKFYLNTTVPTFNSTSITASGVTTTLDFDGRTCMQALQSTLDAADAGYYGYFDVDDLFYYQKISTTPDHYFTIGKDIAEIDYEQSLMEMRNQVLIWNGLASGAPNYLFKRYQNTTSITANGIQEEIIRDGRYKASTGAVDAYGAKLIANKKDPSESFTFRIIDNSLDDLGYNIEAINPGDTCKIRNVATGSSLPSLGIITNVKYAIDYVDIDVQNVKTYIDRSIQELTKRNVDLAWQGATSRTFT